MQATQQTNTKKQSTAPKKEKKAVKDTPTEPVQELVQVEVPVQVQESVETVSLDLSSDVELTSFLDFLNTTSDKIMDNTKFFKDNSLTKDNRVKIENALKKFSKATATLQQGYQDGLNKRISILEKNSSSKSSSNKKKGDKDKAPIHKKLPVHPFLITFMKLQPGTLVSRSEALTAVTDYVKTEKVSNPSIIDEKDKRSFKLIGDLKPLFDNILEIMKSKNLVKEVPTQIKYTEIMGYLTHCFQKDDAPTATSV
jgi:hypothetical protein